MHHKINKSNFISEYKIGLVLFIFSFMITFSQGLSWAQGPAPAVKESEKTETFFICSRFKEVRWLRAYALADGKCKTIYSKEGFTQIISSASFYSSCEAVMLNVKKNIEDGGFKCKAEKLGSIIDIN